MEDIIAEEEFGPWRYEAIADYETNGGGRVHFFYNEDEAEDTASFFAVALGSQLIHEIYWGDDLFLDLPSRVWDAAQAEVKSWMQVHNY